MIARIKRLVNRVLAGRKPRIYPGVTDVFNLQGLGDVKFVQWTHPLEKGKTISIDQVDFYRKLTRPGGMAVDIGAHIGDTTVPMSLAVGRQGMVLALEPNRYVYEILRQNAGANPELTRIKALCYAATQEDGEFVFNYSDPSFCNGGFLSKIQNARHGHKYELGVEGRNIEKYLFENHENDLKNLQLIKVDAEGYDKEILKSMPRILSELRPNLIFECYKRLNESEREDLFGVVAGFGYDIYLLDNFRQSGTQVKITRTEMMQPELFDVVAIHPRF